MRILGAPLHEGQEGIVELIKSKAKYVTCVAPRQVGKSFLAQQIVLYWALNWPNSQIYWIAPTFGQAKRPLEELYEGLQGSNAIKSINRSDFQLTFVNGSKVIFKSAERPDNIRGATATHMIVDEAAYIQETVWKAVLKPLLLVKGKQVLFISTPRGKNWFKDLFDMGQSTDFTEYKSGRMHYTQNPFINQSEIEEAKRTLPEHIFAAEYEGIFTDSGSTVFTKLPEGFHKWPAPIGQVYCGVDLGRANDWTVATFIDSKGQIVDIYRDNQKDWSYMVQEIVQRVKKWNAQVLVESNSIGDVIFEQIKKQWPKTEAFFTGRNKQNIIEQLIVDFNTDTIKVPSSTLFPTLLFELSIFEFNYSPASRTVKYGHPPGMNDDTVMSLAIANECRKTKQNHGKYYTGSVKL